MSNKKDKRYGIRIVFGPNLSSEIWTADEGDADNLYFKMKDALLNGHPIMEFNDEYICVLANILWVERIGEGITDGSPLL